MPPLKGKVALAAGASRGAGRGIALALGDAGATAYCAARTQSDLEETARQVTARGGVGIAAVVDLSDEAQTGALFARIKAEHGHLHILANSAWAVDAMAEWGNPFWQLSHAIWRDTQMSIAACWLTSSHAARLMQKGGGLIVHVTDNLQPDESAYRGQILHDLGHESLNRLIRAMSMDGKKSRIAVVGLNPGFMRTERVLERLTSEALKRQFRFDLSESPEYIGRAVAALAADSNVLRKSGQLLWVADLAQEYGFTDVDGRWIPRFDPNAP